KEGEKTTRVVNRKQPFSKIKDCDEPGCFPNTCPNNGPNFVGNLQENQVRSYKTMSEGAVKEVEKTTHEQLTDILKEEIERDKVMGSKVTMEDLQTKPSSFRRDSYHKAEEKTNTDTKEKLDELQSVEKDVLNYLELTRSFVNRNLDKAVGFVNELSKLKERETLA